MIPLKQALSSSLGKKYLMAISGLGMVGFLVTHLLGNLQLYFPDQGKAFNLYAQGLADLGPLLWVAEAGLIGIALLHIFVAFGITAGAKKARGSSYEASLKTKGGPSYSSAASKGMIITGLVLLVFIVVHVLHMKFGVFSTETVNTTMQTYDGKQTFDLYGRVKEAFTNPGWVIFYVAVMLFLGAHTRHGFFSAFQSLGALNWRLEKPMDIAAKAIAAFFAIGFLLIPVVFFIRFGLGG